MDYTAKIFKNKINHQFSIILSKRKLKILKRLKNPKTFTFKDIKVSE